MQTMLLEEGSTRSQPKSQRSLVVGLTVAVVVLATAVVGLSVALGLKMRAVPAPVSVNLGGVPNTFQGAVTVSRALDSAPSFIPTSSEAPANLHDFAIDMEAGMEQVILRGTTGQLTVTSDFTNGVQKVTSSSSCTTMPLDFSENGWNFRAVAQTSMGTFTLNGATCERYEATRVDSTTFQYSLNSASGALCHIMDQGQMIVFYSFSTNVNFADDATVPCVSASTKSLSQKSIFGDIWNDVKCTGCKTLAESVLEAGVEGGCTLISDGLADELCEAALETACEGAGCSDRICDAVHLC